MHVYIYMYVCMYVCMYIRISVEEENWTMDTITTHTRTHDEMGRVWNISTFSFSFHLLSNFLLSLCHHKPARYAMNDQRSIVLLRQEVFN